MSFGWSVGDVFAAIEIIYEVSEALRSSTGSPNDRLQAKPIPQYFESYHYCGAADLWT